jgi:hypothetical protein
MLLLFNLGTCPSASLEIHRKFTANLSRCWDSNWMGVTSRPPIGVCSEMISPVLYPLNRDISSFWRNNCDTWRYTPHHTCAYIATWHRATFSSERDGICLLAHYLYRVNNVIGHAVSLLPIAQSEGYSYALNTGVREVAADASTWKATRTCSTINIKVKNILQ